MVTNPSPDAPSEERRLTREEGLALFDSLRGCMEGWFPEEGGVSGLLLKDHEAWAKADEERDRQIEVISTESAAARERQETSTP